MRWKNQPETPKINVSDRKLFKKTISNKHYKSFEYDVFKVGHSLWFWFKNIDFEQQHCETKKTNAFHCFSLILIKNHNHSWFFNQNYSECPTLKASFSKPRQYFFAIYFLLKSSRSETFIFGVSGWFFHRIVSVDSKHYQTVDISWFWRKKCSTHKHRFSK